MCSEQMLLCAVPRCAPCDVCSQAQHPRGDPASPDPVATISRHIIELKELIASLDTLLPYLNLAIAAAGLLASGEAGGFWPSSGALFSARRPWPPPASHCMTPSRDPTPSFTH